MSRKWLIFGVVLVVSGAGGYWVSRSGVDLVQLAGLRPGAQVIARQEQPAETRTQRPREGRAALPVEVARATATQVSDDIAAIGTLLSDESVSIAPETSGRVATINFKDGDTVAGGAVLFTLDAELANAALADAKAKLALAQANFGRSQQLQKSGTVARSTYDEALAGLQVAEAAVDSMQLSIKKLTITAPFSGALGFRTVSIGAYIAAGTDLVKLDKIDLLKVGFSLPELEQARIALGQQVEVKADALPGEGFVATISAIDPVIDVNGRALRVRAELDNAALRLRPGLLVRITVKGDERNTVMVPEEAIVQRGDSTFVYLAGEKVATEAKVETGKRVPGSIEIVNGVSAGAEVIVAGNSRLSDGASIEIVPAQTPVN